MKNDLEKTVQGEGLHWLNSQPGVFAFSINNSAPYSEKLKSRLKKSRFQPDGIADVVVMMERDNVFFIEYKRGKSEKLRLGQIAFEKRCRLLGISYYRCNSIGDTISVYEKERSKKC